jgi:tetratricopeptide (TPR) repeat protein
MDEVEVRELTRRASELRSEGRLDESLIAARHATTRGPKDANAWWQLALTLRDFNDDSRALPVLERVTELAPHFAAGWYELGLIHQASDQLDDAIAKYEMALTADSEHAPSMRMLASALKSDKSASAAQRRLELLGALYDAEELPDNALFDFAYLLAAQGELVHAARMYERYTCRLDGKAAYFNLALAYKKLGRDADALDAFDMALFVGYENDKLPRLGNVLYAKLLELADRIARKHVSLLAKDEWYQHYVNPFELLDADTVQDLRDQPKAVQKARQAVLREIELEDGNLAWMPGLVLDKSTALSRLDELNNPDAWDAHQVVFENRALCSFLSRGELDHFVGRADQSVPPVMPYQLDESILRVLGPAFAAQYNRVLIRAIELGNVDAVECLFKGRRWVAPEHEEHCFEGARRALERLAAPLVALDDEADGRTVGLDEIQQALAVGSLHSFLPHLPIEFHATHNAVGRALRGMAVSHFGREHDALQALEILKLAKVCADKLPALAHLVKADEKTLNDMIAEERSKEASITVGRKLLQITRTGVSHGAAQLSPGGIIGVRWGMAMTSDAPPTMRHTIGFQGNNGEEIVAIWTKEGYSGAQRSHWSRLIDAAFHFVMADVLGWFAEQIEHDHPLRVGSVDVGHDGVTMDEKGWIFTSRITVPWHQLTSELVNGSLVLGSRNKPKARADLPLETTWNAVVLHLYASKKE